MFDIHGQAEFAFLVSKVPTTLSRSNDEGSERTGQRERGVEELKWNENASIWSPDVWSTDEW
ncbi:hypothetical protein K0M31_012666, partial [Melipona bicolor]